MSTYIARKVIFMAAVLLMIASTARAQVNLTCNGSNDTAAISSALSAAGSGVLNFPPNQTCVDTGPIVPPTGITINLQGATLEFTGSGGGACSAGINGLIQFSGSGKTNTILENGYVTTTNSSAGCLVNISNSTAFISRHDIHNVVFSGASGTTSTVGVYVSNAADFYIRDNVFGANLAYDIYAPDSASQQNSFVISGNNFQPLAMTTNYQIDIANVQAGQINSNTFEGGPNGILANGVVDAFQINGNWMGDASETGTWINVYATGASQVTNNFIVGNSEAGSVGISLTGQSQTASSNYIQGVGYGIKTGTLLGSVITGNNLQLIGSIGIQLNGSNAIAQGNLLSLLGNSAIGIDSENWYQVIGPNQYYEPGSGSVTLKCGTAHDTIMEQAANVSAACTDSSSLLLTPD
jgi:hypothetical protein